MRILPTWINDPYQPETSAENDPAERERRVCEQEGRIAAILHEDFEQGLARRQAASRGRSHRGQNFRRECWCVETGEHFESLAAAARSIGIDYSHLWKAIRQGYSIGKKHWTDKPPNQ